MDPNGFYVDLVSNSSNDLYSDNVAAKFMNKLHYTLDFGDAATWEVGLAEIFYPATVFNIYSDVEVILLCTFPETASKRDVLVPVRIQSYVSAGFYKSARELCDEINRAIHELWLNRADFIEAALKAAYPRFLVRESYVGIRYPYFKIKNETCAIYPHFKSDSIDIEHILGFSKSKIKRSTYTLSAENLIAMAQEKPRLPISADFIMIYSDVIRPRLVGDSASSLLRSVPIIKTDSKSVSLSFDKPHYFPVAKDIIESIGVILTDIVGNQIKFGTGIVKVCLHFRRRQ